MDNAFGSAEEIAAFWHDANLADQAERQAQEDQR